MIVAMKKARIIVQTQDAAAAIGRLGALGVLHIENSQLPRGKDIDALREDIANVEQAINCVTPAQSFTASAELNPAGHTAVGGAIAKVMDMADWKFSVSHILDLHKRVIQLEDYSEKLKEAINEWQAWGDFEPEAIRELESQGVIIRLYRITKAQIQQFPEGVIVNPISIKSGLVNCAAISREKIKINFKEVTLPAMGLNKMRVRLNEDLLVINQLKSQLHRYGSFRNNFLEIRRMLKNELEQKECLKGMAQSGELVYLTGYAPADTAVLLEETARKEKWGIWITEPSPEDVVPTLIRNPRWISTAGGVFKMLEIIPGYRELDISFCFLVFFSLFTGILIGDAGYGLVYLILTLFLKAKAGKPAGGGLASNSQSHKKLQDGSLFVFLYILCFCAIVWGVLSATFFGQQWLVSSVKPLIPALKNDKSVQVFCFFLGALHLSLAHLWRALLKAPSLAALSDIGWVAILWGSFLLAKLLVLGYPFPVHGKWLFIIGCGLVILFNSPQKNPFKMIGSGLGTLALSLVNTFTDVVSYIRLFAVSLAAVAVADTANTMAAAAGGSGFLSCLAAFLILFIGHSLNILLGPIAILVHGVRLNVLEFSSHLDIKWTGFTYKPFTISRHNS